MTQANREGIQGVVGHHDVGPVVDRHADSQNVDDVRMPGEPAHRVALTQKAFPALVVEMRRQHLDRDVSSQRRLVAAINHAGAATADLPCVLESSGAEFVRDPA